MNLNNEEVLVKYYARLSRLFIFAYFQVKSTIELLYQSKIKSPTVKLSTTKKAHILFYYKCGT